MAFPAETITSHESSSGMQIERHKLDFDSWFLFVSGGSLCWMAKVVNGERRTERRSVTACEGPA
jgi:hypothetical protein